MSHELKIHLIQSARRLRADGFHNTAQGIEDIYMAEFGPMPSQSVYSIAGAKGGKATGEAKRRDAAHYARISALGVAARVKPTPEK